MNLAALARVVDEAVRREPTVGDVMNAVLSACENERPHSDWAELRRLAFGDLKPLRSWIEKPFRLDPPPPDLAGLWFGLFNPEYERRKPTADLYVSGSNRFTDDPCDNGWAVGPQWRPDGRYARSSILNEIYRIAYRPSGLGNDAEYPLCLAYGAAAVRDLLRDPGVRSLLQQDRSVGVAVGFDGGDFIALGRVAAQL